jgi:hypothetical protein
VSETEDDPHGGLEAVLRAELDVRGLPPEAGLTGLVRHLENSRTFEVGVHELRIQQLEEKLNRWGCICKTSIDPDCRDHEPKASDEYEFHKNLLHHVEGTPQAAWWCGTCQVGGSK